MHTFSSRYAHLVLIAAAAIPASLGFSGEENQPPFAFHAPDGFSYQTGGTIRNRLPVRFNDDLDNKRHYKAKRFWNCRDQCPSHACDHRTHEPVWDYLYVGGRVDAEDDLAEVELTFPGVAQIGRRVRLTVAEGADCIRLWPNARKGRKTEILTGDALLFSAAELPKKIFVEGIQPGGAVLCLVPEADATADSGDCPELHVDVIAMQVVQGGKQKVIYHDGELSLQLVPAEILRLPDYRNRIRWEGDANGNRQREIVTYDPGDKAINRRAIFRPAVTVNDKLSFSRKVRVRQKTFTGTSTARTTAERRREVENLVQLPPLALKDTELPNHPTATCSQAWFERHYTGSSTPGDPVKPINKTRLQYAPLMVEPENTDWDLACCYLSPYGVFITQNAYNSLQLEDLIAVAQHEVRHLEHYSSMYAASGFWHVLCRNLSHQVATYFMEADASSASLHSNGSWRFLEVSAHRMIDNYRNSDQQIPNLPSLQEIESAITVLHDIYSGLPADMDEFKRPGFDCYIRPPLEMGERDLRAR